MMKYRIITKPYYDGTPKYVAQKKILFFWIEMNYSSNLETAKEYIKYAVARDNFKSEIIKEF